MVPGRVISTVDPEARHARKSRSRRSDGYKAHICAEPDTGLITAVELTTADTSDAQVGPRLLQQDPTAPHNTADTTDTDTGSDTADTTDTDTGSDTADTTDTDTGSDTADTDTDTGSDTADTTDTGSDTADTTDTDTGSDTADTDTDTGSDTDTVDTAAVGDVGAEGFVGLVLADSAYASGEALDAFAAAGYGTAIKPIDRKPRIAGGFTRDDFTIDTDAQTVTCPAGHYSRPSNPARPASARCAAAAPARPLHHLRRRAQRHRRRTPPTPTGQQDPLGTVRNPGRLPPAPPHGRTLHRVAHPQQGQTRPLPRRRRQPPLAHHQSCRRQPHAPHQPRPHPQQRRIHPVSPRGNAARPGPHRPQHPTSPNPADRPRSTDPADPTRHRLPRQLLSTLLGEDIDDYMAREVLPHVPDAWVDHTKTKIGYEIPLNRHFYVYEPPRPLDEIDADLHDLEHDIIGLLADVTS